MVKAQAVHVRFNSDSDRLQSKRDPALKPFAVINADDKASDTGLSI